MIPVKIHSSVVAIQGWEFVHRMQLTTAILNDELKEIGEGGISSLHIAGTHRDTRRSRDDRGGGIRSLPGVDECDSGGWGVIGKDAFKRCTSLKSIVIPDAVKMIRNGAFYDCLGLTTVILGDGLEEIRERAFDGAHF